MAFSFLNLFKKKAAAEQEVAPARPPVEKPSSERLSKTVRPSGRTVMPSSQDQSRGGSMARVMEPTPPPAATPRTLSFGAPVSMANDLPPAVAVALEPKVERAISVDLTDVVAGMPEGYVRPLENRDVGRRVLLKASELERGMANGRPAVSVATIFEQVPEIFVRSVAASNTTQVTLPFSKVLEQFSALQTRSDQYRDLAVPHVETPFLKVTLEDDERFGTKPEILETGDLPPGRVEPATAESISAAMPEALATESVTTAPAPAQKTAFSLRAPTPRGQKNGAANGAPAAPAAPAGPTRIPFKLTPNGAGVSSPERVPASSGAPVPTSSPAAAGTAPARIPFKVAAPSEDAPRQPAEPWLTKESFAAGAESQPDAANGAQPAAAAGESAQAGALTISLLLGAILRTLPPMQLIGDFEEVASDARLELPFSMVEPQLVTGRVTLKPEEFAAALPEAYRGFFDATSAAPVSLPLQEVLKNLPSTSLRMRDDQEEQEKGANFATPFSAKAEEDAKRFKAFGAPVPKPMVLPPAPQPVADAAPEPIAFQFADPTAASAADPIAAVAPLQISQPTPAISFAAVNGQRDALQTALDTNDELDAKSVVTHVGRMPGVEACAIIFGDGLSLAGNLPESYHADALCAVAPSVLQRLGNHMADTKLGALRAMTLSCAEAAITFFMPDNLCLAVLHPGAELTADVRERLASVVQELSRIYSHPA
ncbi:MAG: hypothetical protein H0W20_10640 [Chthoniobacterales bacterium]|nr:hypothetical protein [Chthoniobacterales bacterium]